MKKKTKKSSKLLLSSIRHNRYKYLLTSMKVDHWLGGLCGLTMPFPFILDWLAL